MADNYVNSINIRKQIQTAVAQQFLANLLFSSEYHFMERLGLIYLIKCNSINNLSCFSQNWPNLHSCSRSYSHRWTFGNKLCLMAFPPYYSGTWALHRERGISEKREKPHNCCRNDDVKFQCRQLSERNLAEASAPESSWEWVHFLWIVFLVWKRNLLHFLCGFIKQISIMYQQI